MIRQGVALFAAYWITATGYAQEPAAVPVITVCEALGSLDAYRGRTVVVVGQSGWTFEGTFMDEKCEPGNLILIQGQRWLSMMEIDATQSSKKRKTTQPDFPADETLLRRKLNESGFTGQIGTDIWGNWDAVYGEIETPDRLRQERNNLGYSGNGYGANGTVPALLKALQIKTLVRGRQLGIGKPPVPELPEPPIFSIKMPPAVAFPDQLFTFPVVAPPPLVP